MIKAGQISKGDFLLFKNEPYLVSEREFVSPGKGSAFVRLKLKSVKSGLVIRETIKSQEQVEDIVVEDRAAQYLYKDGEGFHFMDSETYEQFTVSGDVLQDKSRYLKEGDVFQIVMYENEPVDVKLPTKMVFNVTRAENAIKGDTVSGTTKTVTLETGLEVRVPIFIKEGEKILVNTDTGDYVERAG